jgi:hypothetical protein
VSDGRLRHREQADALFGNVESSVTLARPARLVAADADARKAMPSQGTSVRAKRAGTREVTSDV